MAHPLVESSLTLRLPGDASPHPTEALAALAASTIGESGDYSTGRSIDGMTIATQDGDRSDDPDWPDWYAAYMVAEQAGTELPE